MRTYFVAILLASLFLLNSCDDTPELTTCIAETIETRKADACTQRIESYTFQSQTVYLFVSDCTLDGNGEVLLETCDTLCHYAGPAGFQDCSGDDFYDNSEWIELIWER